MTAGTWLLSSGSPLLTTKHAVVPEARKVKPTGQHEQVRAEAREEAGEAGGLCAEVAEGPHDQDAMRVEAEEIVVGGIQLCGFNQLGGRGCTTRPGGEIGRLGKMTPRVYFVSVSNPVGGS